MFDSIQLSACLHLLEGSCDLLLIWWCTWSGHLLWCRRCLYVCAPLQHYRATLCTIELCCAPPICTVHHGTWCRQYTVAPLSLMYQALYLLPSRWHTQYNWNAYAWGSFLTCCIEPDTSKSPERGQSIPVHMHLEQFQLSSARGGV